MATVLEPTTEEQRDLFKVSADYALAHCVAEDLRMLRGIPVVFKQKFGKVEELQQQCPEIGKALKIVDNQSDERQQIFYLVTKHLSHQKPTYRALWPRRVKLEKHVGSTF